MKFTYKIDLHSGIISFKNEAVGEIRAMSVEGGTARIYRKEFDYLIYGPFGAGHTIGIMLSCREVATLIFNQSDGYILEIPTAKLGLTFHQGGLLKADKQIASISVEAGHLLFKSQESLESSDIVPAAMAVIVDFFKELHHPPRWPQRTVIS
jgi:hypothetical protein